VNGKVMKLSETQHMPSVVLHVSPGGLEHGGGIGRMIGYMIDAWRERPDQPEMWVLDTRGAGHIAVSPWHFARCLFTLAVMTPQRPLLHVHVAGRGSTIRKIILVHLARLLCLPVVLHLHDYDYRQSLKRFPKPIRLAAASMFRVADRIVVLGPSDRDLVEIELGVRPERVTVIPNAVPAAPRKRTATAPGAPVQILFLGNPSRRKGVHDLIAALALEPLRSLQWRLSVAGGGDEIAGFRELSSAAGISDRVSFLGWVDRATTMSLLESADILVLPSYAEGMAMSVLEGMSYGLCIVCTPVGSLKDVIEDEISGLVVQPGKINDLGQALTRAVSDPALRVRLGAEAARVFANKFDAAHYPDQMQPVYEAAFATRSARARPRAGGHCADATDKSSSN
jgi:glycosyltransferase involved in cell wall biosynthesis